MPPATSLSTFRTNGLIQKSSTDATGSLQFDVSDWKVLAPHVAVLQIIAGLGNPRLIINTKD